MERMISTEVREPERLIEEPDFGGYELTNEEIYPELLDRQPSHRRLERREREYILGDTEQKQLPETEFPESREEVRQIPQPKQIVGKTPLGSGLKLKTGERVVRKWSRPIWFMRMSDVKNVVGHDVHLTRMASGVYAFRATDDETMEGLYRIIGKRLPRESDTFGPLKIKSRGKKSRGI